ncbi:MAG: PAS domain-containing protein [Parvularcula sp.]|jgi:PAS domain S-box-containing protein|nr:PAS domain-containing protein [Parvularcula sp.]
MIAVHEGPEHRFIYSNPAHDQAVGYRRRIGLPIREAMREVEGQNVFEHFDQVFHTGKPDEQTEFRAILELVPRERTARYYRQTLKSWRDKNGDVRGVMSFAYDVTAEVEARVAGARQKANLEFALDVGGEVGTGDWDVAADTIVVATGMITPVTSLSDADSRFSPIKQSASLLS